jgi:hypothetical protein
VSSHIWGTNPTVNGFFRKLSRSARCGRRTEVRTALETASAGGQVSTDRPPRRFEGSEKGFGQKAASRSEVPPRTGKPVPKGPSNSIFKEFQQLGRQKAVLGLENLSGKDMPSFQGSDPEISEAAQTVRNLRLRFVGSQAYRAGEPRRQDLCFGFSEILQTLDVASGAVGLWAAIWSGGRVASSLSGHFFRSGDRFRRSVYRRASPQLRIRSCPSGT